VVEPLPRVTALRILEEGKATGPVKKEKEKACE
jgi:hypothetical protein